MTHNKEIREEWDRGVLHKNKMKEFYEEFSNSEFWLEKKYPSNYQKMEDFLRKTLSRVITETINETEQKVLNDYNKFVPEIRKEFRTELKEWVEALS